MLHQPIPTKQREQRRVSNQMDKICSKLQISIKDLKREDALCKSVKLKIQKYIQKDDIKKLQSFLDKKVLPYDVQIGIKSMKWNIMHFAAKNNSHQILRVISAKTYQQSAQKYKQLINTQTSQGYTPLMISIIYSARESFLLMLQIGGSDTQCIDNKRMTAYDLALNYKNQFAIRQLMNYESNNKKRGNYINEQLLLKPIDPELYSQGNCYTNMFDCLVDCFLCFKHSQNYNDQLNGQMQNHLEAANGQQSFLRKSFNGNKLMSLLKYAEQNQIDVISIGNKQIESKYSIQWKKLSTAINQKGVLFDCFQPFDICENNLIIANNLIIFQCLSDHTWLVRKIVKQLKKGQGLNLNNANSSSNTSQLPNQYSIEIYMNDELKKITVDEYIPFLKQRQEPMFLSNLNEIWPQILQKGLAKIYGSYMKLSQIHPVTFVENLTGSYTKSFTLEDDGINYLRNKQGQLIKDKTIMGVLQDFSAKGYVIMLEGRQNTTLSPKNSPSSFKNYCYTILNFYQKGNKKLILVNCPYVLNSWKQKEKTQIMQLKLIKSHYNSHNQMCVWIDENQFSHFFKNIIISFTQPNMIRTQMKIRYLLESEAQRKQQSKLMAVIENITNSAKNIFSSSKNCQNRQSVTSNSSKVKKGSQIGSSISINLPVDNFKLVTKVIFVKFKIQNLRNSESFSLAIKDNMSHQPCKINKFKGWIDGGSKDITLEDANPFNTDLIKIKHKKGEYLCMFEVEFKYYPGLKQMVSVGSFKLDESKLNNKQNTMTENRLNNNEAQKIQRQRTSLDMQKTINKHELLVVCWSQDSVLLQHIEQQFGFIDCLQSWRKNTIKNWTFLDKKQNNNQADQLLKYVGQKIGDRLIVMTKSTKSIEIQFKFQGSQQEKKRLYEFVHEGQIKEVKQGKKNDETSLIEYSISLEVIRDSEHSEFQYTVLGGNDNILKQVEKSGFSLHGSR